jgi:hypothetical protein
MATIDGWTVRDEFDPAGLIGPVAYLAAAGLIAGLIACLRVSPAGPTVAGLVLAGWYGALYLVPQRVIDLIPNRLDLALVEAQPRVPLANGTLAMLSVLFLVALWSPGRWRRWPGRRGEPDALASPSQVREAPPPEPEPTPVAEAGSEPAVLTPGAGEKVGKEERENATDPPESPPPPWPQPAERETTPVPTDAPAEPEPPTAAGDAGNLAGSLATAQTRPSTLAD